jgi:hypothetical protein
MVLAQIAIYVFLLVFTLYLAYRAVWIIFFLFNFRFWQMIFEKFSPDFISSLTSGEEFLLLTFVSIVSYTTLFFTTIRMPIIRYILLAVLFVAAIRVYSLQDILFFKDYLSNNGQWDLDYWIEQLKDVFTFDAKEIIGMFNGILDTFVGFFSKIIAALKG